VQLGVILFAAVVLFGLVTLPVEFDASKRALVALGDGRMLTADELTGARSVLKRRGPDVRRRLRGLPGPLVYFLLAARE
jgi:uncharacterized protein